MKKYIFLSLFGLLGLTAVAQKTIHDPNAQLRKVGSFHGISVSGGIDLYLSEGDEAVAVSGKDEQITSKIVTVIENGVLKIGFDWKENMKITGSKNLKAYVSYKAIDRLSASGGSDVKVDGTIKSNSFALSISGGSDFKGAVQVQKLKVDQSGGSDIDISGSATEVDIDASGGSDFSGYSLTTNTCKIEASGGSDVNITVNKELRAQASGASDIHMRGSGTIIEKKTSGGSDVRKSK